MSEERGHDDGICNYYDHCMLLEYTLTGRSFGSHVSRLSEVCTLYLNMGTSLLGGGPCQVLGQIRSSFESQLFFAQMVPQRSQDSKIALCLLLGLKQKVVDGDQF